MKKQFNNRAGNLLPGDRFKIAGNNRTYKALEWRGDRIIYVEEGCAILRALWRYGNTRIAIQNTDY